MAAAGERYLAANGCHLLGQMQRAQGRLGAAAGTYRLALLVAGTGYVGLAEVAYQRDELDAALGQPRPVTPMSACAGPRADHACQGPRRDALAGCGTGPPGRARSLAGRSRCCPRAGPITDDDKAGTAFRGHGDPHPAGASQCVTLCNDGRGVVGDFARGDEPGDQRPGGGSGRRVFPDAHRRVEGPCVGDCTRGVRRIGAVQVAALPACLPQRLPRAFSMRGRCSAPTGSDRRSAFPAGPGSGVCARRPARRRGAAILGG